MNDLPDDCLFIIFNKLNCLEDLASVSKVCSRWAFIISIRLTKVEYLIQNVKRSDEYRSVVPSNTLVIRNPKKVYKMNLNALLPNLKILDLCFLEEMDLPKVIIDNPKLKGLMDPPSYPDGIITPINCLENIEMISIADSRNPFNYKIYSSRMSQLVINFCYMPCISDYAKHFTNLLRIQINSCDLMDQSDSRYLGPYLSHLKILEFHGNLTEWNFSYPFFSFLDHCPVLESAFLKLDDETVYVDDSIKNYNLKDLVIQSKVCYDDFEERLMDWSTLRILLTKFPNLQHLAIRRNKKINDNDVKDLISLLPKIKLLDFRGSPDVTMRSADYVRNYCEKSDRSIVFYYNCGPNEPLDWHKLENSAEIICSEFNFMKNCFFKHFEQLPYFLDP